MLFTLEDEVAKLIGKKIKSMEFHKEKTSEFAGEVITDAYLGENDDNDTGILLYLGHSSEPIFIYDNERIEVE